MFKYAKAPTEKFTSIALKDIIDVAVEKDPRDKAKDKKAEREASMFPIFAEGASHIEGYNFTIKTSKRDYRM